MAGMRPPLSAPTGTTVRLRGKRVLITGASSGIGEAGAELFARKGAEVIIVARRADLLQEVADRITANGGTATAVPCDLSDLDAVDALVDTVGDIDILVNNAGRSIRRPLADSLDRWHDVERTMALNYYSPLRMIRGFAPAMIERGDGHIINVSTWGVLSEASPLFGVYNASKAALSAVSRVIETEWSRQGVHSTTLYYPLVATPMIAPRAPTTAFRADPPRGRALDDRRRPPPSRPHRPAHRRVGPRARRRRPGVLNRMLKRQRMQPN